MADGPAKGTEVVAGAQFCDDLRAMLEDQRKGLAKDIRESLEKHTQAIEHLTVVQGQMQTDMKRMFGVMPMEQYRSDHTYYGDEAPIHDGQRGFSNLEQENGMAHKRNHNSDAVAEAQVLPNLKECTVGHIPGNGHLNGHGQASTQEPERSASMASKACERLREEMEDYNAKRSRWRRCLRCRPRCRGSCSDCSEAIRSATLSTSFDLTCGGLILCNAMLIGAEVEFQAQHQGNTSPVMTIFQNAFGVIFLAELLLRIHAERSKFLKPPGWKWNVFDLILVSTFVADFASAFILKGEEATDVSSSFAGRILRAARFCRILRTFRLARATSYAHEFRKMAYALQHSAHTLIWALLLLFVVIYCFATTFTQAATDYLNEHQIYGSNATDACNTNDGTVSEEHPQLRYVCELVFFWGSLPRSLYHLYASLCGGVNWTYVVDSLGHVDWTFKALFMVYISLSFFGVLNVVTSVFVECAMASREHFMDIKIQEASNIKKVHVNHLKEVFRDVDDDGSGDITLLEMEELLKNEHLSAYLESIDIRKDDARLLFHLLDDDASGMISINEFCEGCLRLKGEAKSFDIHRLVWENQKMMKKLAQYTDNVNARMKSVNSRLNELMIDRKSISFTRIEDQPRFRDQAQADGDLPKSWGSPPRLLMAVRSAGSGRQIAPADSVPHSLVRVGDEVFGI